MPGNLCAWNWLLSRYMACVLTETPAHRYSQFSIICWPITCPSPSQPWFTCSYEFICSYWLFHELYCSLSGAEIEMVMKHYMPVPTVSFILLFKQSHEGGILVIPVVEMRKLSLRQVKLLELLSGQTHLKPSLSNGRAQVLHSVTSANLNLPLF